MAETVPSEGAFSYAGEPDNDALYKQQSRETDPRKREALLHHPADAPRAGPLRADHGLHLAERGEHAGGRTRPDADRSLPLVGAPGGRAAQEVTRPARTDRRSPSAARSRLVASSLAERSRMMATARVGFVRTRWLSRFAGMITSV